MCALRSRTFKTGSIDRLRGLNTESTGSSSYIVVLPRKLNALLPALGSLALSWHVLQQRFHHTPQAKPIDSHLKQPDFITSKQGRSLRLTPDCIVLWRVHSLIYCNAVI